MNKSKHTGSLRGFSSTCSLDERCRERLDQVSNSTYGIRFCDSRFRDWEVFGNPCWDESLGGT